ncbi:DUF485 domain-containing protein [Dactylosporangium matsuzakiense]|uniref:Clumping factor B n=1 Tax=Dactylosporangium matsuzakiense TaxID=53360 RepID=A0A9W6KQE4_9ACTN|nr:DUF485 domain-containing protein [Dactylosporangium matsuzakiense]UWZ44898.1 DUF485 domain-containing protein [Dactylosporangium matsuzakiense]GLL03624.1 clumping factor B [Dactylosporangium matsuzakiense]
MSTETPAPAETGGENRYIAVARTPEFDALRSALRKFVFPVSIAFLVWYALYVLLSAYARDFMSTKVVGNINVALIFGLLQFVSTFLIAWLYARYADRRVDPLADDLRAKIEGGPAPVAAASDPEGEADA